MRVCEYKVRSWLLWGQDQILRHKEVCFIDNTNKILVTTDESGKKLVVIPQVIFKGKRSISWEEVKNYLIRYIGEIIQIAETKDIVNIDKRFVDEFCGSEYTIKLKGALTKAKANLVQGLPKMIEIATDKRWSEDFGKRHDKYAKNGWYRYNTRFALPVINGDGTIERYNTYSAVLIIRYSTNGKLYLYDVQNIRKE